MDAAIVAEKVVKKDQYHQVLLQVDFYWHQAFSCL
jgi:hypothetical protein